MTDHPTSFYSSFSFEFLSAEHTVAILSKLCLWVPSNKLIPIRYSRFKINEIWETLLLELLEFSHYLWVKTFFFIPNPEITQLDINRFTKKDGFWYLWQSSLHEKKILVILKQKFKLPLNMYNVHVMNTKSWTLPFIKPINQLLIIHL